MKLLLALAVFITLSCGIAAKVCPEDKNDVTSFFTKWTNALKGNGRRRSTRDSEGHTSFHYLGPDGVTAWPEQFPQDCAGQNQSPVNINYNETVPTSLPPLSFVNYRAEPASMELLNNLHTLQVSGRWCAGETPFIVGGPLDNKYQFWQMHFHWAQSDDRGSEHTFDGKSFPMEVHLVHYNTKYGSGSEAASQPDGLAVVGYIFQITDKTNPALAKALTNVQMVSKKMTATKTEIKMLFPLAEMGVRSTDTYVTYPGSLTTPPCTESVRWLMFETPLRVTMKQMSQIRDAVEEKGQPIENFRPTQPLNGRTLRRVVSRVSRWY